MECRMDGRVALITGSSRGLGRAMAMTFARAGARVAVTGRRTEVVEQTCAEIEAEGVYGDKTKVYVALKRIAQYHLPLLRKILNGIALWATAIAFLTGGGSLGVAAGAATMLPSTTPLSTCAGDGEGEVARGR